MIMQSTVFSLLTVFCTYLAAQGCPSDSHRSGAMHPSIVGTEDVAEAEHLNKIPRGRRARHAASSAWWEWSDDRSDDWDDWFDSSWSSVDWDDRSGSSWSSVDWDDRSGSSWNSWHDDSFPKHSMGMPFIPVIIVVTVIVAILIGLVIAWQRKLCCFGRTSVAFRTTTTTTRIVGPSQQTVHMPPENVPLQSNVHPPPGPYSAPFIAPTSNYNPADPYGQQQAYPPTAPNPSYPINAPYPPGPYPNSPQPGPPNPSNIPQTQGPSAPPADAVMAEGCAPPPSYDEAQTMEHMKGPPYHPS